MRVILHYLLLPLSVLWTMDTVRALDLAARARDRTHDRTSCHTEVSVPGLAVFPAGDRTGQGSCIYIYLVATLDAPLSSDPESRLYD